MPLVNKDDDFDIDDFDVDEFDIDDMIHVMQNDSNDDDARNIDAIVHDLDDDNDIVHDMVDIINDDDSSNNIDNNSKKPPIDPRIPVVDVNAYFRKYNIVSIPPPPVIQTIPRVLDRSHSFSKHRPKRRRKRKPGVKPSERKSIVANKRVRVNGRFVKSEVTVNSKS